MKRIVFLLIAICFLFVSCDVSEPKTESSFFGKIENDADNIVGKSFVMDANSQITIKNMRESSGYIATVSTTRGIETKGTTSDKVLSLGNNKYIIIPKNNEASLKISDFGFSEGTIIVKEIKNGQKTEEYLELNGPGSKVSCIFYDLTKLTIEQRKNLVIKGTYQISGAGGCWYGIIGNGVASIAESSADSRGILDLSDSQYDKLILFNYLFLSEGKCSQYINIQEPTLLDSNSPITMKGTDVLLIKAKQDPAKKYVMVAKSTGYKFSDYTGGSQARFADGSGYARVPIQTMGYDDTEMVFYLGEIKKDLLITTNVSYNNPNGNCGTLSLREYNSATDGIIHPIDTTQKFTASVSKGSEGGYYILRSDNLTTFANMKINTYATDESGNVIQEIIPNAKEASVSVEFLSADGRRHCGSMRQTNAEDWINDIGSDDFMIDLIAIKFLGNYSDYGVKVELSFEHDVKLKLYDSTVVGTNYGFGRGDNPYTATVMVNGEPYYGDYELSVENSNGTFERQNDGHLKIDTNAKGPATVNVVIDDFKYPFIVFGAH